MSDAWWQLSIRDGNGASWLGPGQLDFDAAWRGGELLPFRPEYTHDAYMGSFDGFGGERVPMLDARDAAFLASLARQRGTWREAHPERVGVYLERQRDKRRRARAGILVTERQGREAAQESVVLAAFHGTQAYGLDALSASAHMDKPTIYQILRRLKAKGFVQNVRYGRWSKVALACQKYYDQYGVVQGRTL